MARPENPGCAACWGVPGDFPRDGNTCFLGALGADFRVTAECNSDCVELSLTCRSHPSMLLAWGRAHWVLVVSHSAVILGQGFSASVLVTFRPRECCGLLSQI